MSYGVPSIVFSEPSILPQEPNPCWPENPAYSLLTIGCRGCGAHYNGRCAPAGYKDLTINSSWRAISPVGVPEAKVRGLPIRTVISPTCARRRDRKSTRLNSSHLGISYAVFCLKKKKN